MSLTNHLIPAFGRGVRRPARPFWEKKVLTSNKTVNAFYIECNIRLCLRLISRSEANIAKAEYNRETLFSEDIATCGRHSLARRGSWPGS